ncbi:L-aminoadipate-semialdehyde dehydrogenase large subunit [Grifola frondosa]|uniref:L-aminoadipate-semialdehyde dehydrogenase large subunit n=1 Tax=Grifola frondosa TaxID=5627 RepID=A0A1C7MBN8_GRIFR|nr:L-aminoadipate-semialdehyde dehydrogenase large subunit [Grifola frondosa]
MDTDKTVKFRTMQGASSATFRRPPLDSSLTVPELFAYHATNSPNHPVFVYADDQKQMHKIYYPEVYKAIRKAAKITSNHYLPSSNSNGNNDPPTIGILAVADLISFYTLLVGIMYLGFTTFPISTRNSAIAVAHLIRKTGIRQLFVSTDPAMQRLAHEAIEMLAKEGVDVEALRMPDFVDMYNDSDDVEDVRMGNVSPDNTALILHSSGESYPPCPIKFLDRNFLKWGTFLHYGDVDMCGVHLASHTLPMFHVIGALTTLWTACAGVVLTVFKPTTPPIFPAPDVFLDALVATRSEIAYCVPAFVEAWARSPGNLPAIKTLRAIIYAGAPMNKQIGDQLAKEGIALIPFYGLTEGGAVTILIPDPAKMNLSEWDYFEISCHLDVELVPHEGQEGTFEPVIFDSPGFTPNVMNTTRNGRPAYATSDLLQVHPTKPHLFKVFGRADDQLMLSTGEKTNPGPLEAILLQDPHIVAALMFGRGRFQNGVLIQPKEPFDPKDERRVEEFRNTIWPSIEKANHYAPSHSRIFKEMIMVTNPTKPLEYTAKGTPRRQVCIQAYNEEIDALYRRVAESSQTGHEQGNEAPLLDDDDLFQQGCDSLQATWIRNSILHALRSTTIRIHDIPSNFVYAHPSIRVLSDYVTSFFLEGKSTDTAAQAAAQVARMRALVEKYGTNFHLRSPVGTINGEGVTNGVTQTVLLTGTTGRLGCHLLAQLLQNPEVVRVYALNRESSGKDSALKVRQRDAFTTWGLDVGLLSSPKVTFHVCNFPQGDLGLNKDLYKEIQDSVTIVIHNAWRVDFNVSLSSFEPLIAGVRNLLDLCLDSPLPGGPRVLFVSSIAALRTAEDPVVDAGLAVGTGYSESKWVAEQLFGRVAQETGLRTTVIRVGQLSGDTRIGGWSPSEWVPALVSAGQVLGCIPARDETVTWIAVDVAAAAILDMVHAPSERVLHLTSPRPVAWNVIFDPRRPPRHRVPYPQWLARLQDSANAAGLRPHVETHHSAHNLLEFFKSAMMGGAEVPLSTKKATKSSRNLAEVRPLCKDDAIKYVQFWASVGHIKL